MLTKLNNIRERLVASYWFLPAVMSATASTAAVGALKLDAQLSMRIHSRWFAWLDVNTAEGARELLSTIAGSTITLAGVIFSITVLALSFASSQYGPRLLRSFMRDRSSQIVLGTFVSTYLYSLLVLRTIGSGGDRTVVPHTAVAGALLLALVSMAVLIFFIHHIAHAIQASSIVDAAGRDLDRLVVEFLSRRKPPANFHPNGPDLPGQRHVVASSRTGYVQAIAAEVLLEACTGAEAAIELLVSPGDYVGPMFPIASIRAKAWSSEFEQQVRDAVVIGVQRTSEQDMEFPLDQLAEVAVRALSPGLNDPFTAVLCIERLGAAFAPLFAHEWQEGRVYSEDGVPLITFVPTTPERVLHRAFDQILHFGATNPVIPRQVMKGLWYLHRVARPEHGRAIVAYASSLMSRAHASEAGEGRDAQLIAWHRKIIQPGAYGADDSRS